MPKLLLFIVLIITFSTTSRAQLPESETGNQPEEPTAITLPSDGFDPLKYEIVSEPFDGFIKEELTLQHAEFLIRSNVIDNWILKKPTPAFCSVQFQYRYNPEITLEISVFDQSKLSAPLEESLFPRLFGGIFEKFKEQDIRFLTDIKSVKPSGYYGRLLQKDSFFIEYEYSEKQQNVRIKNQRYLLSYKDKVIMVSLIGPQGKTESLENTLKTFVYNLSVETP